MISTGRDDTAQRRQAVDPARSVIVQAPAGSGKTTLLVERYLALLAVVEAPEQILAITFTRKAAAEMRARILRFLQPGFSTDEPHEQTALACAQAVADKVADWELRQNPQRLMIRTIDSFSHYLARNMPVASRLGPVPQPADNAQALYRRAARRVLELGADDELAADLRSLLLWRDHRTQDIEDLLSGMLGRREQWLRALGSSGDPQRAALEQVLDTVIRSRLSELGAALHAALTCAGSSGTELAQLLSQSRQTLLNESRPSDILQWQDNDDLPPPEATAMSSWQALAEALLTKDGHWRKSVNIGTGCAPKTDHKAQMQALLANLADDEAPAAALHAARCMPQPQYEDDEWEVLLALVRVLQRTAVELQLLFAETGQTDFTGLSMAALTALGDDESGYSDLSLSLDQRISHILVDEYQDTNWAQFELLEKLTHGWQPDDGRTLFAVGDPMQSIYRFREAEVGLFMRTRDHGLGALRLQSLQLTRNFRSRAEIVDWVNAQVGPCFPQNEDIAAGAVAYAQSQPGRGAGGSVQLIARADPVAEAEAMADVIAEALVRHKDDPDYKAAIIVRARSHLQAMLPVLQQRQIAYRAVKLDPLLQRPLVQDLFAITRAILLQADLGAVLAVLRSPLCGLCLADLLALAQAWQSATTSATVLDNLSADGRQRAQVVLDKLQAARLLCGRRSMSALVQGVWHGLGGVQTLTRPAAQKQEARLYLQTLEQAEQHGLLDDLNDFQQLLEEQYTEGDPPDAQVKLEILTMHAAKGLEWDLVLLPGLHRGTGMTTGTLLHWLPYTPVSGGEQVLLAPLRSSLQANNSKLIDMIRAEQQRRSMFETQRLLYVAATRAKQQLVLGAVLDADQSQDEQKPAQQSLLAMLWPRLGDAFYLELEATRAKQVADSNTSAANSMLDQSIRRLPTGWQVPVRPGYSWSPPLPPREPQQDLEFNWAGQQARRTGMVIHSLLEVIAGIGLEHLETTALDSLKQRVPALLTMHGTASEVLDQQTARVIAAVDTMLQDSTGRWLLSGEHADAASELALTGMLDGQLINAVIDRTFIDADGVRWIIDYKSGHHQGGDLEQFMQQESERYRPQLQTYRRLFEQMEQTQIQTALYFPLHGRLQVLD
ncbi:MAG: UvrD-helicase domain-containing protein [Gammaproteobacteria bacterium]|jgi:ATP-dependent helicase/nuclease subunit A|nr:UvrD-helicase domain-containing protein [Gammaproteobacteria bacterium]